MPTRREVLQYILNKCFLFTRISPYYIQLCKTYIDIWMIPVNVPCMWDVIAIAWHGNAFCIAVPLWGESTDDKRTLMWRFDVYFPVSLNRLLNKQWDCQWIETHWRSCDVTEVPRAPLSQNENVSFPWKSFQHWTISKLIQYCPGDCYSCVVLK